MVLQLAQHQLKNYAELLELVERMRAAFEFCKEANKVGDDSNLLKPKIKVMLRETVDCSRFVQEYARNNFARTSYLRLSLRGHLAPL